MDFVKGLLSAETEVFVFYAIILLRESLWGGQRGIVPPP